MPYMPGLCSALDTHSIDGLLSNPCTLRSLGQLCQLQATPAAHNPSLGDGCGAASTSLATFWQATQHIAHVHTEQPASAAVADQWSPSQ